jgi:hypothetical protein
MIDRAKLSTELTSRSALVTFQARPQSSYPNVVGKICNAAWPRYEVEFVKAEG